MKNIIRKYFPVLILLAMGAGIITAQSVIKDTPKSPSEMGQTKAGKDYIILNKEVQKIPQKPKLAIRNVNIVKPAEGSVIGKSGQYIIVVTGEGFLGASLNPIIHIGKLPIEDTYMNKGMTELYGVIQKDLVADLRRSTVTEVRVQNSGGLNEDEKTWASLRIDKGQINKWLDAAKSVEFVRGDYTVEMRK